MRCRLVAAAVVAVAVLFAACESEEQPSTGADDATVTVEDAIAAISQPGMVFFLEAPIEEPGQELVTRLWYDPGSARTRTETHDFGVLQSAELVDATRTVSYSFREGFLFDHPTGPVPAGAPTAALAMIPHVGAWLQAGASLVGETEVDGVPVYHVAGTYTNTEPGDETPDGTEFTLDAYIRADTLLPVMVRYTAHFPDDPPGSMEMRFSRSELVPRDSLPGDFFDLDALAANDVTIDEALAIAARQPFATFWLGPELAGEWTHPGGQTYAKHAIMRVRVPGTPDSASDRVSLEYGPGIGVAPALLQLDQGPAGTFEPLRANDLAAIRAAGNVREVPGLGGYVYVRYVGRADCSDAEAQAKPECRMPGVTPHRGVVVEREGTVVHLSTTAFGETVGAPQDENPFATDEALIALAGQLARIP
ncbi:MAG: hypothetical protein IT303_00105 [Dehalococcoidia bacterium]|nr:hypothetical protein [Dehalococcoidia bacterium]